MALAALVADEVVLGVRQRHEDDLAFVPLGFAPIGILIAMWVGGALPVERNVAGRRHRSWVAELIGTGKISGSAGGQVRQAVAQFSRAVRAGCGLNPVAHRAR